MPSKKSSRTTGGGDMPERHMLLSCLIYFPEEIAVVSAMLMSFFRRVGLMLCNFTLQGSIVQPTESLEIA